jgi:hypothetical protein
MPVPDCMMLEFASHDPPFMTALAANGYGRIELQEL